MNLERAIINSENETVKMFVNVLGAEKALALVKIAGGAQIYIPSIDSISQEERNAQIYDEFIAGATYKELHLKYRLSEKRVREIVDIKLKHK